MKRDNSDVGFAVGGCLVPIIIVILNVTVGTWSVNEILSWFGKDIPLLTDAVVGLFTGEVSIPVAIVGAILKAFGVF